MIFVKLTCKTKTQKSTPMKPKQNKMGFLAKQPNFKVFLNYVLFFRKNIQQIVVYIYIYKLFTIDIYIYIWYIRYIYIYGHFTKYFLKK